MTTPTRRPSKATTVQRVAPLLAALLGATMTAHAADKPAAKPAADKSAPAAPAPPPAPAVVLPLERTAYFIGETVPLAFAGVEGEVELAAVNDDGRVRLYKGPAVPLWLSTQRLAPGDYRLELNGAQVVARFTLTSPLRVSPASLQDESLPGSPEKGVSPEAFNDGVDAIFRESGVTACVADGAASMGRLGTLDTMARSGALLLVNPDTRPTSFCPTSLYPDELDQMSQRMLITSQANGRYPNFGGFCYGWDPTGYAIGGRKMLLTYWNWNKETQALRDYIAKIEKHRLDTFTQRTGFQPVTESELISYFLSIKRPEFASVCDLPTLRWVEEVATHVGPMSDAQRVEFEKRLDAWSNYLMNHYNEVYGTFSKNLRDADPTLRNTASVQVDHCMVRMGQYFPSAYAPLDFRYQSTWNDQVGGPDYSYQWLLTQALLDMGRGKQPTWISNGLAAAHDRARYPGKFIRSAAHGLAFGATGAGFALEAFSNIFTGMNGQTHWQNIKGKPGGADLVSGRDFLRRFASIALEGQGAHGVGILFSKAQFQRDSSIMGFGQLHYRALVALTRAGYTPCFVTEEDLAAGKAPGVKALLVAGITVPLPAEVRASLERFASSGGTLLVDDGSSVTLAGAKKLGYAFPLSVPGKPHSWSSPNMAPGENDTIMVNRWEKELGPIFEKALGDTGRAALAAKTPGSPVTLMQIDAGADATFVAAINDSHVKTQADWHQVRETLTPRAAGVHVYDCTLEQSLGAPQAIDCDLTNTTVRLYALLPRPIGAAALSATQKVTAGGTLSVALSFNDDKGKPLAAALPFELTLVRPDGKAAGSYYRATTAAGQFAMNLTVPANAPAGEWKVEARSLLTGVVASLPVSVAAPKWTDPTSALSERIVTRDREGIAKLLAPGATLVLPVFDSPKFAETLEAAQAIKTRLAAKGVTVEIREKPALGVYTFAYSPTPEQLAENAKADAGEVIGKAKVQTLNGNDWYSYDSGFRFGKPVILLDLADVTDNPMAETLTKTGVAWPRVTATFPGAGKAVVQAIHWAFSPRNDALIIQAPDAAGLLAAADSLAGLPDDKLTPGIRGVRKALWEQYHIGSAPDMPKAASLSANGLSTRSEPKPLTLQFGDEKPPTAQEAASAAPAPAPANPVPDAFNFKKWTILLRDGDRYIDSKTVDFLKSDLRFNDAFKIKILVPATADTRIAITGLFRYSDRKPCWQAQWEDIINLREKLLPNERKPMEFEVFIDDKSIGVLKPTKTEQRDVKLELASPSAGLQPRTANEEVVTELSATLPLPAGEHEIRFVHRNIVDGSVTEVGIGADPKPLPLPEPPKPKK